MVANEVQTITIKVDGTDHHLICYYRDEDIRLGRLGRPTTRAEIMALTIPPEMVRGTNFRHPPHIEIGPDGRAHMYASPNISLLSRAFPMLMCPFLSRYDAEEADSRRQKFQSSPPSLSRASHQPVLSIDTLSQTQSGTTSPTLSSPAQSLLDYGTPPSAYSPAYGPSYGRADGSPPYATRSSPSWQEQQQNGFQPEATMAGLPSYGSRNYYAASALQRSQTPAHFPIIPPTALIAGSSTGNEAATMPERPATAAGWYSPPPFAQNAPSISSSRYYAGPGNLTASDSSSAASSPIYAHVDPTCGILQPSSSYPPYERVPSRFGLENTSYSRGSSWAYEGHQHP
jgi:hypothetical protein